MQGQTWAFHRLTMAVPCSLIFVISEELKLKKRFKGDHSRDHACSTHDQTTLPQCSYW